MRGRVLRSHPTNALFVSLFCLVSAHKELTLVVAAQRREKHVYLRLVWI